MCGTANSLELQMCSACGTGFAAAVNPPSERPPRDPGTSALVSLFWPGAGHAYLGLWGDAIARSVLTLWVLGVVLLTAVAASSVVGAALFGAVGFMLWIGAAHDAYREASHRPGQVLLKGRGYLYVVLGLLVAMVAVLLVSSSGSGRL